MGATTIAADDHQQVHHPPHHRRRSRSSVLDPAEVINVEDDDGNNIIIDLGDDDDGDFGSSDSQDSYVQISSESSDDSGGDSRKVLGRSRTSSQTMRRRLRQYNQRLQQEQKQQPQPVSANSTTNSTKMPLRKRSFSIFADDVISSEDEGAATDTKAHSGGGGEANDDTDSGWSVTEKRALLQAIEQQLPDDDTISYTRRLKSLKWEQIQLDGRTEQECKIQLMVLLKKIRHVRSLRELFGDVHQRLDNPRDAKKSAYSLFCADYFRDRPAGGTTNGRRLFTDMAEAFRNLAPAERQRYDDEAGASRSKGRSGGVSHERKCAELMAELERQPGTPLNMFCREEVAQGRTAKMQMRSDYAQLDDEQRIVYVRKAALEAQAKAVDPTTVLTTKDFRLLKTGSDPKKSLSMYNLFVREFYQTNTHASFHEVSKAYRELPSDKREVLREKAAQLQLDGAAATSGAKKSKKSVESAATVTPKKALVQTSLQFATPPSKRAFDKTADSVDGTKADGTSARKRKSNGKAADDCNGGDDSIQAVSPIGNSTRNIKQESNSESESSARKRKRIKKETSPKKTTMIEPDSIPSSLKNFFCERIYEGKPKKAAKAFDKLDEDELFMVRGEYKKCREKYMGKLELYLASLSKEEMVEYAQRHRDQTEFDDVSSSAADE